MKGHGRSNVKQLILTTGSGTTPPRLFYVDAVRLKLKECELRAELPAIVSEAKASTLVIWQAGKPQSVQCLTTQPPKWIDAVAGLLAQPNPSTMPPIKLASAPSVANSHSDLVRSESSLTSRRQKVDKI